MMFANWSLIGALWLLILPSALWVGLIAIGRGRVRGWWAMAIGNIFASLGAISALLLTLLEFTHSSLGYEGRVIFPIVMLGGIVIGPTLFVAGFAMAGAGIRAGIERQRQLEAMTDAMGRELALAREKDNPARSSAT